MYIEIDKAWFDENLSKFIEASDVEGKFVISDEELGDTTKEVSEITEEYGIDFYEKAEGKMWIGTHYKPTADEIVNLVELEIDNIKGEALAKIIEIVVKKLNKFKSLIETIKGL